MLFTTKEVNRSTMMRSPTPIQCNDKCNKPVEFPWITVGGCRKSYPHSHPLIVTDKIPTPRPKGCSVNPVMGPDFRIPLPRLPSSAANRKRGGRWEKNKRRKEIKRAKAVAKAKAEEGERAQFTVASVTTTCKPGEKSERKKIKESQVTSFTREEEKFINYLIDKKVAAAREGEGARVVAAVIHRHGEKTDRSSKVLKEESKEVQVWFALRRFAPIARDALIDIKPKYTTK